MAEMKKREFEQKPLLCQVAKTVAIVAGLFSLVMCVLLIADYIRIQQLDPLNHPQFLQLRKEFAECKEPTPELIEKIRVFDLMARRDFFASQAQRRLGGSMLLGGAVVLFISLKLYNRWKPELPDPGKTRSEDVWEVNAQMRQIFIGAGVFLLAVSLFLAFVVQSDLSAELERLQQESFQGSEMTEGKIPPAGKAVPIPGKSEENGFQFLEKMKFNWPNFRGPGGYAHAYYTNAPTAWNAETGENILWKAEIPAPGFNSPIVWNKRVFLTGGDEEGFEVYCFDADTGKMLWNRTLDEFPGSPKKLPDVSEDTGYAAPSMATDGQRVFAIFATGDLACYDFNGNFVWGKNIGVPDNSYGHASSLITDGRLLFVQYDQNRDSRVMAFDNATGKEVWRTTDRDFPSWASPILIQTEFGMQLIVLDEKYATAYEPATGKLLWRADCLGGEVAPSAAYNGAGIVVVANEYAQATALKLKEDGFETLWQYDDYLPEISSPLASEKYFFIATSAAEIVCLDIFTGKTMWEAEFEEPFSSSPVLVGNRVYVLDQAGGMHILKVGPKYKELSSPSIGENCFATPAYVDGRIYLRTDDYLYCIGK